MGWSLPMEKRFEKMHDYEFSTTEAEPVWDAADCTRLGKDVFVQHSKTTNKFGFEWLRRHLAPRGITAHLIHFPYDIFPSHIDCTFVPLRPGLVLTNYERPVCEEEVTKFREGNWKFVDAPRSGAHQLRAPGVRGGGDQVPGGQLEVRGRAQALRAQLPDAGLVPELPLALDEHPLPGAQQGGDRGEREGPVPPPP